MELWIRSQNGNVLMPVNSKLDLFYDAPEHILIISNDTILGAYKSRDRVLEVLDEIQNKLKTLLYLKPNVLLKLEDIKAGKSYFEELNKQEFLTCDNNFEIIPISSHVVVYEMPKE